MALIRICEGDNFFADYDTDRGMYRVSAFEPDVDFIKDEYWFDAYEEKEVGVKDISQPIKKVEDDVWWCGYCPRCNQMINYNRAEEDWNNRKQYCWQCGQLVEFK